MKAPVLAGIVAGVFAAGIGVGVVLNTGSSSPGPAPQAPVAAPASPEGASKVTFDDSLAAGQGATPGGPSEPEPPPPPAFVPETPPAAPGQVIEGGPAPEAPPPLSPGAMKAESDLRRELDAQAQGKKDGRVRTLVYDFDSEEERLAWEEKYRARWEKRLLREIEIKIKIMREKVGLQAHQERDLRALLEDEYKERDRLVSALTAKEISRSDFDQGVRANVAKAKERLQATLTPEQYQAYLKLKPREQVLNDEAK